MANRAVRRAGSAHGEARRWRERHDALMTVVNAILYAYGNGPDARLAVSTAYLNRPLRNVATSPTDAGRFIVYLEPVPADASTKEEPDAR